ncbi:N-acetyl-D-Glu racemase DgcA [Sphingomonas sp.]|uniref:N-acetyl-D-Glu racemase DgcA n=1 Tax=Sphingomonas sp. TaxID=28214 RepID=UPI002CCD65D2|nr:N-acetyl-D-Glu racemase DgcA [Sphingomonas sp.]HWK35290.1 N-acetyl-D-Glu racemase DgcA [Sphingomonas sp.]
MTRTLSAEIARFPLSTPFRISRGVKTVAEVVEVEVAQDGAVGRGEGMPYARYGESLDGALAEIAAVRDAIAAGAGRDDVLTLMRPGAARNAVDCALWDLEATLSGKSVSALIGDPPVGAVATAMTVGLDTPEAMGAAAAAYADYPLVKIKVDRNDPLAQIRAVRAAAPRPRIIVDPNESWTIAEVRDLQSALIDLRIDLLEQPLPSEDDGALAGFTSAIPIAADESAHVAGDIDALADRYQVVNIKLDKTGGLTAALTLADAAVARGLGLMTGCMVSSSLSIAPAMIVAARSGFVDLDGPLWLANDRPGGVRAERGMMRPPSPGFWGGLSA